GTPADQDRSVAGEPPVDVRQGYLLRFAGPDLVEDQGARLAVSNRLSVRAPGEVGDDGIPGDGFLGPAIEDHQVGRSVLALGLAPARVRRPPGGADLRGRGAGRGVGELPDVPAVPVHDVDLPVLAAHGGEGDPPAVWRPPGGARDDLVGRYLAGVLPVGVGDLNGVLIGGTLDVDDALAFRGQVPPGRDGHNGGF